MTKKNTKRWCKSIAGREHTIVIERTLYINKQGQHREHINFYCCSVCRKNFPSQDFTAEERAATPVAEVVEVVERW